MSEIKRNDLDRPIKGIVIEYEDGSTRNVDRGFIADVSPVFEPGEEDMVEIRFDFVNIGGKDIKEVIYSVTDLGIKLGLFDNSN